MNRSLLIALAATVVIGGGAFYYFTQQSSDASLVSGAAERSTPVANAPAPSAAGDTVNLEELLKSGAVPDNALGDPNAPVTVDEYASLTCSHCRVFHDETLPEVKKRLIDTGKVRLIYRDFPLDQYATAGAMLARCAGDGKYFPVVDAFFAKQNELLGAQDPFVWLQGFAKQLGFTQESLEACLSNQGLMDNVLAERQRASEKFGVSSTPTFFFNGRVKRGALSIEEFEKEIASLPVK